jgi:hypothetical protein
LFLCQGRSFQHPSSRCLSDPIVLNLVKPALLGHQLPLFLPSQHRSQYTSTSKRRSTRLSKTRTTLRNQALEDEQPRVAGQWEALFFSSLHHTRNRFDWGWLKFQRTARAVVNNGIEIVARAGSELLDLGELVLDRTVEPWAEGGGGAERRVGEPTQSCP